MNNIRVGQGFDVHKLVPGQPFWLGGIQIDSKLGAEGHSDADVLLHAICDALLGAVALGDIGKHFPPSDATYKNIDSKILLKKVAELIGKQGWHIGNIDSTVSLQLPKLRPNIDTMRKTIAEVLNIGIEQVSVKATTTEQLGFEGRQEGVSARAVVLVHRGW